MILLSYCEKCVITSLQMSVLAKAILVQIHKYDGQIDTDGEYICTVYMKYTIAGIMCFPLNADAHLCPSTGYLGQI